MNSVTHWGRSPSPDGIRRHPLSGDVKQPTSETAGKARKGPLMISAPSRIRTCAHGSGENKNLGL